MPEEVGEPHQLRQIGEQTFFLVSDPTTNKIHIAQSAWSYDADDPQRSDDLNILRGYLDIGTPMQAVRVKIDEVRTMVIIHSAESTSE